MNREDLLTIIDLALDSLIKEQSSLLDLDVSERALSHYLAFYIQKLIPAYYNVDVEYNRHRMYPKRLNLPPRKALDDDLRATTVYPDIIIHRRNTDEDNLLVLELKNQVKILLTMRLN
jgi:hypothetical protein